MLTNVNTRLKPISGSQIPVQRSKSPETITPSSSDNVSEQPRVQRVSSFARKVCEDIMH